jgi:hypothetical protein
LWKLHERDYTEKKRAKLKRTGELKKRKGKEIETIGRGKY